MTDNYLKEKYLFEASQLSKIETIESKTLQCESPSNIALVKYWGKYGEQLPRNASVSFTLSKSVTKMTLEYSSSLDFGFEFIFEGQPNAKFETRMKSILVSLFPYFPFLQTLKMKISSSNTFPHSSGIASSASSISALALLLCKMEQQYFRTLTQPFDFFQKASFIARLGSGSACRSVFAGVAVWGKCNEVENSSNECAVSVSNSVHPIFQSYNDAILIINSATKSVSSTAGHHLMNHHSYANARYQQASENISQLLKVLIEGDEIRFAEIVENEALSLHGLMLSSVPNVILLHPNTIAVINKLKQFRMESKLNFAFTLDAGPNIHLLYSETIKKQIFSFINNELVNYCENRLWIDDKVGFKEFNVNSL